MYYVTVGNVIFNSATKEYYCLIVLLLFHHFCIKYKTCIVIKLLEVFATGNNFSLTY